jgi:hypothetical protein
MFPAEDSVTVAAPIEERRMSEGDHAGIPAKEFRDRRERREDGDDRQHGNGNTCCR